MTDTQQSLLPETPPKGKFRRIKIEVFKKMKLIGPSPSPGMIASVRAVGVFQPIAVFKNGKEKIKIGAGVRRVLASIAAEKPDVPCMVFDDEGEMRRAITLMENANRSGNPVGELEAIEGLIKAEFSVEQIAHETGMPIARVRKRLELKKLHADIYAGVLKRKVSINVAQACMRLPMAYQEKLSATFTANGKLTMDDVAKVKTARREEAIAALPQSLLGASDRPKWTKETPEVDGFYWVKTPTERIGMIYTTETEDGTEKNIVFPGNDIVTSLPPLNSEYLFWPIPLTAPK